MALDTAAPPLRLLAGEARALAALRWRTLRTRRTAPVAAPAGRALVIPGFLASDGASAMLRARLAGAGWRAEGWGMGRNLGPRADTLDRLAGRIAAAGSDAPVTLIGWSLGGLYAREAAKLVPDRVRRVVTLGSPFSGDPRANNAWRLYQLVSRTPVDRPPVAVDLTAKPPVETIALWSRRDGIVAPASARGRPEESDRCIEVDCTHMGFMTEACAADAILALLAADQLAKAGSSR